MRLTTWFDNPVDKSVDDDQRVELGVVYRLELAAMPFAVWNGERFVGPRERFHLRLLETATRADGGWVERVGGPITGILLVAELEVEHCATCDWDVSPSCKPKSHRITEAMAPNRPLIAAIDEITAPWLELEAEARAAAEVGEILVRAFRWESHQGYHYDPSAIEAAALCRRLRQLGEDDPERITIETRFPNLVCKLQA
jgi:hypothetical protein